MKLRTKKRLLDAASLSLLAGGAFVLWEVSHSQPPSIELTPPNRSSVKLSQDDKSERVVVTLDPNGWNRTLRQPLYDPPPPPKQEVVVERRPITVKLVGTVIEPENSQAFIRQSNGRVEIKRTGDAVTADAADGVIATITPVEVVISRADGEHRLSVEGRN